MDLKLVLHFTNPRTWRPVASVVAIAAIAAIAAWHCLGTFHWGMILSI
jgi:hypothetical protein